MKGQATLATGAATGRGLAAAQAFAAAGAAVVLADINEPTEQTQQLRDTGCQAQAIRCDVANEREVEAMIAQTVATFGRLDAAYASGAYQAPKAARRNRGHGAVAM